MEVSSTMNKNQSLPVLVAIDDGETRHAALEFAADHAVSEGRALRILHVTHPVTATFGLRSSTDRAMRLQASEACQQLLIEASALARRRTDDRVPVATDHLEGLPLEVILHESAEAVRVVLQRRHLSPLDNIINGPVVAGVSARAEVPVVVVPETAAGWRAPGRRRVTVAVKRWAADVELIDAAFDTAQLMGARLQVLSVLNRGRAETTRRHADLVEATELHLREQVQGRRDRFPGVEVDVAVRVGKPALELLQASTGTDLMLISRPFTHLRATALGTLSRALIRESACAIEIVPGLDRVLASAGARHSGADAWGGSR